MVELVLNDEHLDGVLNQALALSTRRLFISTADVKDLHVPTGGKRSRSILQEFRGLSKRGVEIRLLHGGVPSGAFINDLKKNMPPNLVMRRCPRVHAKAIIADGKWMYLGSANLTGAGIGAKSARRRNFEAGVWTDDVRLIDPVADMLDGIWTAIQCPDCDRKKYCPVPLEEPEL